MKRYLALSILIILTIKTHGQNVGIGTITPNASAILDISDSTRGILIPRLTFDKRNAIVSPANGLLIFQTDNDTGFYYYQGIAWLKLGSERKRPQKLLYVLGYGGGAGYMNSVAAEYWIMNTDGTNAQRIPIIFNPDQYYTMSPKLSPDGQTIFFSSINPNIYKSYLYSCSLDGSNLVTIRIEDILDGRGPNIEIGGVY